MKPVIISKGDKGQIQVAPTQFKNVDYIDVRNFYKAADGFKPTPKGLMIPLDNAEDVAKAILSQLGKFKAARTEGSKFYVVMQMRTRDKLTGAREYRIPETRVYEDLTEAKRHKAADGSVIFAFIGDYELDDTTYVFAPTVKKRRVVTRVDGRWVKQADL